MSIIGRSETADTGVLGRFDGVFGKERTAGTGTGTGIVAKYATHFSAADALEQRGVVGRSGVHEELRGDHGHGTADVAQIGAESVAGQRGLRSIAFFAAGGLDFERGQHKNFLFRGSRRGRGRGRGRGGRGRRRRGGTRSCLGLDARVGGYRGDQYGYKPRMPWCGLHSLGYSLVGWEKAALRLGRNLRSGDGVNGVVCGVEQSLGRTRSLRLELDQS